MKKLFDYFGDYNIGFFGRASDKIFISSFEEDFYDVLKVDNKKMTIGGTKFIGLFSAMNSNGIVLPYLIKDYELKEIKKIGLDVCVLKEKFTAIGNLIVANDKGAIVSVLLSKNSIKKIEDTLKVEVVKTKLANSNVVGSVCFATNKGAIIHREATDEDLMLVRDVLKVDVERGSVNFGSPFVSSGIIANSYGAIIGSKTSGYELDVIFRALKI